jgi:hypothetical protein
VLYPSSQFTCIAGGRPQAIEDLEPQAERLCRGIAQQLAS